MKNLLFVLLKLWIWWTEKTAYIYMKSLSHEFNVFTVAINKWWERYDDFKKYSNDILIAEWNYQKIKDFTIKNKIDIIYMHWVSWHKNSSELIDFLKWAKEKNIKIIETSPFSLFTPETEKFLDYKLFVSKTSLLKFLWKFKSPNITKYDYLYNPLDTELLEWYRINNTEKQKEREKIWIKKCDFVIWKVWRADLWKRDDTIIDIVPLLVKDIPNLKIVIRALPRYKLKKIKRLWLEKYFVLLPESVNEKEIANTYQIMDVMLHTSRIWESFWIALAEWMFYWLPVLTTDTDRSQRTAFDRDNSQWEILWEHNREFISNDLHYLANKIIELYKNVELRKDIWDKNSEYVQNHYLVNILKNKLLNILNNDYIADFNYKNELLIYEQSIKKQSFIERLLISIKAAYESFFNK